MPSFPQMHDLPSVVDTAGWQWSKFQTPVLPTKDFWLGIDRHGNRWLTKLRGDFYAYREIVFARLAQQMGWSCQSSVFMRIDAQSAALLGVQKGEIHAAHWFMEEHIHLPCVEGCSLTSFVGKPVGLVEDLENLNIAHISDWPKSELAACLFGGNEPPGRLFTASHEFVIIDSEQMFASSPSSFDCTSWWGDANNPQASGQMLAKVVCAELVGLGTQSLNTALALPPDVIVNEKWPIAPILHKSFDYAKAFCNGKSAV
jgi:hypothetical protein